MSNRPNPILKVILLGDSGVGKSSLINRYVNEKFSENNMQTIGVDLFTKIADVEGSKVTVKSYFRDFLPILVANLGHRWTRKISSSQNTFLQRRRLCCFSLFKRFITGFDPWIVFRMMILRVLII